MTMAMVGHIPPLLGGLVLKADKVRVHCEGGGPRRTWNKGNLRVRVEADSGLM